MLSEHVEVSRKLGGLVGAAAATAGVYGLILRPRMVRWGATDDELKDPYPGRELVPDGIRTATMAVTIAAPPAKVWPWLIQMGYDRAGYYSWDHLDNGGRPSAKGIHPEWQDLSVGDHLSAMSPTGPMDAWEVAALEPERFLGLRGLTDLRGRNLDPAQPRPSGYLEGLWGFLLKELPDHRTRLVVGGYQAIRPRWLERLVNFWFFPPIHWTMQTRQFTNLTRNIESDQQKAGETPTVHA